MAKIRGAYAAGQAQGFANTLISRIEKREQERQKYLDNIMDNARATAPKLAQSDAEIRGMMDMQQQMQRDFGITSAEFMGLAQNYDINAIYKNVYTAQKVMEKNNIAGKIDKAMILGGLKIPENFELPEGVTPEQGLRMIFQGAAANLKRDPSNKSESHVSGSFGKAIADMMALNPKASAQDMADAMQVGGVPVERLTQFQATGGVKQQPFSMLKAEGPFAAIDIDYTDAQFKTTTNTFASVFSRKFAGSDDPTMIAGNASLLEQARSNFGTKATAQDIYDQVFAAGNTVARLEKQLIGKGLNVGMGQSNTRYDALSGVAARLENVQEMQQLVTAIEAGDPVAERIIEAYGKDQMITDKEMDYILYGDKVDVPPAETPNIGKDPEAPAGLGGPDTATPRVAAEDKAPKPEPKVASGTTTAADLIARNKPEETAEEEEPTGRDLDADLGVGYEERVPTVSMAIEKQVREALAPATPEGEAPQELSISYEAWKDMSKEGRKRFGLDVSQVAIQNMVRGGRIPVETIDDEPVAGLDIVSKIQSDEQLGDIIKNALQISTLAADSKRRERVEDAEYEQRNINQELMDQDRFGLMSPASEEDQPSVETESIDEPVKPTVLADLSDMVSSIHGSSSKVAQQFADLLEVEDPNYTQINKIIRATKKLRKTATRDKLLRELQILANKARM